MSEKVTTNEKLTALFHKLEIDGKTYYECRSVLPSFTPNERFANLQDRQKSDKKDFYLDISFEELSEKGIKAKTFFIENNGLLSVIRDQKLITYIKTKFDNETKVKTLNEKGGGMPQKLIDAYVKKIEEDIKCQKKPVREIISTIIYNRELNKSSLTTLTKSLHHDNIVLFGPYGSGEDLVLESVEKNLQIPVVHLMLTGDLEYDLDVLAKQIEESGKKFDVNALVILGSDFKEFAEEFDGDLFAPVKEITNYIGTYKSQYLEKPINFNELTYLVCVNVSDDMMNIANLDLYFQKLTGLSKPIELKKLTMTQVRDILYQSTYSVLKYCEDMAMKYGREFTFNKKAISDAIRFMDFFGGHVNMLNSAILENFKEQLNKGKAKIVISTEIIEYLAEIINVEYPPIEHAPSNKVSTKEETNVEEDDLDPVDKITNEILKTIRGQDKQVRRIVKTILKNIQYANDDTITSPEKHKKNILIRGDSGTGKTEIIRRLASIIGVPIFVADATQYTEEGYVGDSVNEMLLDLYHEAGDDIKKAERGILVIDEIDKKANGDSHSDVSRGAVLQSLLKIVEGTKKRIKYEKTLPSGNVVREKLDFDTRRLSVICLGAFEELEKYRENRVKKATKPEQMGFADNATRVRNENKYVNKNFINEDYSSFGMAIQFINRFENKVYLNKLTKENLVDIMKNSNLSALKMKQEDFIRDGIVLEFTDDFYDKLGDLALSKKAGARGISEALEDVFETLGLNDINTRLYSKIVLNGDCINNVDALVMVPRETEKQMIKK